MGFSKINILYSVIAISIIIIGFSSAVAATSLSDQATWIQSNDSTLKFTFLEATIHVVIKIIITMQNFLRSVMQYSGEGTVSPPIDWKVIATNPTAIRMINVDNPGGDLGWEVDSGQTRAVTFTMVETFPPTPFFIQRAT